MNDKWGILIGLLGWILIFSCCGGLLYNDVSSRNAKLNAEIKEKIKVTTNNQNLFKIVAIYPEYGAKSRFIGHYAICEGLTDKTRLKILASKLPAPGEVWEIGVMKNEYIFIKLVK